MYLRRHVVVIIEVSSSKI
uniref:Uncharacterized protein n=1 Tax=Rhizophora mucronata TaxID=61149 RepID=A0A2P2IXY4_RHIMU